MKRTRIDSTQQLNFKFKKAQASVALLVIDEAPIRQAAIHAFESATSELEYLKQQWSVFTDRDQPAYVNWMQSTFSNILNAIQDCAVQINDKRLLIAAVEAEAEKKNLSYREAFENVLNGKAYAELVAEQENEEAKLNGPGADNTTGSESGDNAAEGDQSQWASNNSKARLPARQENRLKQLYRLLARRMHPDVAGPQTKEIQALWLEVQEAYEARDLPGLESIYARTSTQVQEKSMAGNSIGELKQLFRSLMSSVRSLRKELQQARRDRAWGFSQPGKKPKSVSRAVKNELEAELREVQEMLSMLERFVEAWVEGSHVA